MAVLDMSFGERHCAVTVRRGALRDAGSLFRLDRRVLILTDAGVPEAYTQTVAAACREPFIVRLAPGEQNKCPDRWLELLRFMAAHNFDRHDCVVTVGGGVVGDLGGFAAAAYMRGIDLYTVPTTLLSQIDASVGGKTAIDLDGYKNVVGAFWQPSGVLIDPDVLDTLPARQFACGMAEIIKMAATHDRALFSLLESSAARLPDAGTVLDDVILRALSVKKRVVEADERESGQRQALNFGHTIGHAVEAASANAAEPLLHGECVGLGMLCVTAGEVRERIAGLLLRYGLPLSCAVSRGALIDAVTHDKKSDEGKVHVVRVPEIGQYTMQKVTVGQLAAEAEEVLDLI